MIKKTDRILGFLTQFIKFGLVGGVNTLVSLAIYYLMVYFGIHYMAATVTGYIASSIVGYLLNKVWVFEAKKVRIVKSLAKYYIVYGASLLINMGCMYLFVSVLAVSKYVAPVLTMCVTVPFNYIFSRIWVYR